MAQLTPTRMVERAPRVKLGGSVLALVILESKREVRTAVHQLSVNGGLLKIEKPLDEQIKVTLMFHIGETTIRAQAKMLFPMWATNGWLQPFQFLDFPEADKQKLDAELATLFPKPAPPRPATTLVPPRLTTPPAPVTSGAASDSAPTSELEAAHATPGSLAEAPEDNPTSAAAEPSVADVETETPRSLSQAEPAHEEAASEFTLASASRETGTESAHSIASEPEDTHISSPATTLETEASASGSEIASFAAEVTASETGEIHGKAAHSGDPVSFAARLEGPAEGEAAAASAND
jgi:hypothetical protein